MTTSTDTTAAQEKITRRWEILLEARLIELRELGEELPAEQKMSLVRNQDEFWNRIFDELDTQLRELNPNHEFLPENYGY